MQLSNFKSGWKKSNSFIAHCMRLVIGIGVGIIVSSSSHIPSTIAQTNADTFPGKLIAEGTLPTVSSGHELISLGQNRILDWESLSGQYRIWQYDLINVENGGPFLTQPSVEGLLSANTEHELIYLGGSNFLDWEPTSNQYRIRRQVPSTTGNTSIQSTQPIVEGTLKDIPSEHKLIYVGYERVLDWEPASGQYRIWQYDSAITGTTETFPGELIVEGIWPTIRTGHELVYLGYRRILDWEPETGRYRIWRYDPMVTGNDNPLVGEPLVEGTWGPIRNGHQLISLRNNNLLEWAPETGQFHVWQFELISIAAFTPKDIAEKLRNQTITGVTGVTHGFQLSDSGGDSLKDLATDIHNRAGGWLLDYAVDDNGNGFFEACTPDCADPPAPGDKGTNEMVLLFDWAPGSNEPSSGWGEAAGDALFSILVDTTLVDPTAIDNPPYHFIGHSFGTAVTSEVIERLAYFGIPVDHVTFLDPHDFDQGLEFDGDQRLFDLGKPVGYGVTVWNNVAFADVYYQTRGESGNINALTPNGRPIPGAYNRFLLSELPNEGEYPLLGSDHSYIWDCFYRATVTGTFPINDDDCPLPDESPDFSQTGYAFSRIEQPGPSRPARNFYTFQSHTYSNPKIVNVMTGEPNKEGLDELGLTVQKIIDGQWDPDWNPLIIVNGDFEHYNDNEILKPGCAITNTCVQPGWSHHGGGGDGHFDNTNNNIHLELDAGNTFHTHNWFYIPLEAIGLQFDLRRVDGPLLEADILEVRLGDLTLDSYVLSEFDEFEDDEFITRNIELSEEIRGQVNTLTFVIVPGGDEVASEVRIDNIKFVGAPSTPIYLPIIIRQ